MAREFTPDQLYGPAAGPEIDGTPLSMPSGFRRPPTLLEQVRRLVRTSLSEEASAAGGESFDEFHDFDIPDDPVDPTTPFEEFFDPLLGRAITPDEMRRFDKEFRQKYLEIQSEAISREEREAVFKAHIEELRASSRMQSGQRPAERSPLTDIPPKVSGEVSSAAKA